MNIIKIFALSVEFSMSIMGAVCCIKNDSSQAAALIGIAIYIHLVRKEMR